MWRQVSVSHVLARSVRNMKWAVVAGILMAAEPSWACQCGRKFTPAEGLANATAVFEGRVIDTRIVLAHERGWLGPVPEYEFLVSRMWKGSPSPTVTLRADYSNCARLFTADAFYLVYAWPHEDIRTRLSSTKCDPTTPISDAEADLAALGPAMTTYRQNPSSPQRSPASRVRAYALGGVAAYANLVRHPTEEYAWNSIGIYPLIILTFGVLTLAMGLAVRLRRRKLAFVLIAVAPGILIAALFAAGKMMFRNSWFSQYLQ